MTRLNGIDTFTYEGVEYAKLATKEQVFQFFGKSSTEDFEDEYGKKILDRDSDLEDLHDAVWRRGCLFLPFVAKADGDNHGLSFDQRHCEEIRTYLPAAY